MTTVRPDRALVIALFAALHLVLQPLAAGAPCAMGAGDAADCCCASEPAESAAPSCCSAPQEEAPAPDDRGEEDCDCTASPDPTPTTPEAGPELPRPIVAYLARPTRAPAPADACRITLRRARARAPGDPPDLLLLHQVFLL